MSLVRVYSNNGMSYRCETASYKTQAGEVAFPELPLATPAQLAAAFPGYVAAVAAASAPPPTELDAATLAAVLIARGVITQGDLVTAIQGKAGAGVVSAVGTIAVP